MEVEYVNTCDGLHLEPDPSVLVSLQTNWEYFYADNSYSLLPLFLTLARFPKEKLERVKEIRLVPVLGSNPNKCNALTESNARVISQLISLCSDLELVDLTNVGLGSKGVIEVANGVTKSSSLHTLVLRQNPRVRICLSGYPAFP